MPNHDRFECQTLIDLDAILHEQNSLGGLPLYIAWYGSGEGVVFERNRHDDIFGLMTVTFFSHLITGWGMSPVHARY
ncbi:hypothetical protein ACQSEM_26930, partial [Salmonella enterica]